MNPRVNDFLGKMGLTEYEAKTLSALFSLREADSPAVSKMAQVPKTRVYDVLDSLVSKGVVLRMDGRPKKYRALKPVEAFEKLLTQKQGELNDWKEHATALHMELEEKRGNPSSPEEKVLKVKSRTDFYKILAQELDDAKTDIIGLTRLDVHHHLLHDSIKRATERNVSVKLIGEHPPAFAEKMSPHKNVQLKEAQHGMHAYVIDGKKVVMMVSDMKKERDGYHFAIWPDNPGMAQTIRDRFDKEWAK